MSLLATVRISFTYFRFAVQQLWAQSLLTTLNSNHHLHFFTPIMHIGLRSLQSQRFRLHWLRSISASLLWKIRIFVSFFNTKENEKQRISYICLLSDFVSKPGTSQIYGVAGLHCFHTHKKNLFSFCSFKIYSEIESKSLSSEHVLVRKVFAFTATILRKKQRVEGLSLH